MLHFTPVSPLYVAPKEGKHEPELINIQAMERMVWLMEQRRNLDRAWRSACLYGLPVDQFMRIENAVA